LPVEPHAQAGSEADYRSPTDVWNKFIREQDQIFLVLSGHFSAQALRVEENRFGHKVVAIMSDFQNRQRTANEAGRKLEGTGEGIGDGWLRLMAFDMGKHVPEIRVRTYSTHYKTFSTDASQYAAWYKAQEKPQLTDADYVARDDFTVELADFRSRFARK